MITSVEKDLYEKLAILFGGFQELIQGAGGNISIKTDAEIIIKASGTCLSESDRFLVCRLSDLSIVSGSGKPSMEAGFHLLPKRIIVHFHSLSCLSKWKQEGNHILRLPYVQPGDALSQELHRLYKGESIIYLENHGVVLLADTEQEIYELLGCLYDARFLSIFHTMKDYYERTSFVFLEIDNATEVETFNPFTPDIFLFLKRKPLHLTEFRSVQVQLDEYQERENLVSSIVCIGTKVFATAFSWKTCILVREMYTAYCKLLQSPPSIELTKEQCAALLSCEKEAYRLRL